MNLPILLIIFLLGMFLTPADAASPKKDKAPRKDVFTPVNQGTRFQLTNTLAHLTATLAGSVENMVMLRAGEFQRHDQIIVTQNPDAKDKKGAWVQMNNYWIEPTMPPPSQGEAVMVPIDDMRVAEVQGEAKLTEFSDKPAGAKPIDVNEDMEVPEASTLGTSGNGSVAVVVGGHTSIRLIPNSQVQFYYDVSGVVPRLEIKILKGGAFCKIGKLSNGKVPDVGIRGPMGEAAAIGSSDFFVQADLVSLHVCLVRGRLLLGEAIPLAVGNMDWYTPDVEATAETGPQIRHWPQPAPDAKELMDAHVLSFALHQVDRLNVKIKNLLSPSATPLSSDDQAYLAQIPRITWYAQATAMP